MRKTESRLSSGPAPPGIRRSETWRSALAALSLANLFLIRIWTELLGEHTQTAPPVWYAAALVNLLLLTGLIWTVTRWGGIVGRGLLGVAGLALFAKELTIAAGHEAAAWKGTAAGLVEAGLRQGWFWPLGGLALMLGAWGAWHTPPRWIPSALAMLSPILFVTAGQVAWRAAWFPIQPPAPKTASSRQVLNSPGAAPGAQSPRIVWIIFDELDERVAFAQRPASLRLPALDTFRAGSVVFRQAVSPANSTSVSIPMLLGQIFERPGVRAGLIGWHLPYCPNYGSHLVTCQAWAMDRQLNSYGSGLGNVVRNQLRSLFESSLYSLFGQSLAIEAHARTILEMEDAAARLAARPDLNLVFLHLPVPHPPFVYDPGRGVLSATNQDARGYLANLELADRLFARISGSLTASGLWDQTHVLVSGDHGFRQAFRIGYPAGDLHVPWMWKPAGAVRPRELDRPFETRATAGLVSRLLDGENAESVLSRYP